MTAKPTVELEYRTEMINDQSTATAISTPYNSFVARGAY